MERGQLGVDDRPATVFVFDGLIAVCEQPRLERWHLRLRHWDQALQAWTFDYRVCDYIYNLIGRYNLPIDVVTWRPSGFAAALHDRLWEMDVPVRETKSAVYRSLSQRIATDPMVSIVYDADESHRYAYGYKRREFSIGRY